MYRTRIHATQNITVWQDKMAQIPALVELIVTSKTSQSKGLVTDRVKNCPFRIYFIVFIHESARNFEYF